MYEVNKIGMNELHESHERTYKKKNIFLVRFLHRFMDPKVSIKRKKKETHKP